MICDISMMHNLMQDKLNLVLKENLFSLKNLTEIFNGSLHKYLEKCLEIFFQHVNKCQHCLQKGRNCEICKSEKKIFIFELGNMFRCLHCKRVYHLECSKNNECVHCQVINNKVSSNI